MRLAAEGCHVAICDLSEPNMAETKALCEQVAPAGTRITNHVCNVAHEEQVIAFRDAVQAAHRTERVNLLFNNAGIGGAGSFVADPRADWERTFNTNWLGVYFNTRAFLPLLIASDEACLVNISSVNGFWACLGARTPHTAYSTAKFAVKGFSEGLLVDLRVHAPHVKVALVMPGHIGTDIAVNARKLHGKAEMSAEELALARSEAARMGTPLDGVSDADINAFLAHRLQAFRDSAPLTPKDAVTTILDGVREGRFRILVGDDAEQLDALVRATPDEAYLPGFARHISLVAMYTGGEDDHASDARWA